MIAERDIERWFESSHFRRKCDWVCVDQPKVIKAWLDRHFIGQVIISDNIEKPQWLDKFTYLEVPHNWLSTVTQKPSHPGIMVIIERPVFKISNLYTEDRVVLLDTIQDPGNLGSILRSMIAFGIHALCVTDQCVDVFHPKAVNASSGALANIAIYHEKHWNEWLQTTKAPIMVLDPLAAHSITDVKQKESFVLVCGSEGRGVQNEFVKTQTITPISIAMSDEVESLNAAVSMGIALHQLTRT